MNLKILFNFPFFKENIRKSKGLLAFLLGVIPIINIIFLIIVLTSKTSSLLTFNLLSIVTYLGLIFIPLALSLTLFGFVFKKKSVDFVMSKPISRKSLFITNTLGGIIIILIFMLINTLIFGLFSLLFSSITIPFALLLDYFIFWLVSYIFMFIISNLAIILAGNFLTSLVILIILICIIPYLLIVNYVAHDNYASYNYIVCDNEECQPDNYYCYNDTNCEAHLLNNEYMLYYQKYFNYHFISPFQIGNTPTFYNNLSIIKMLLLSIIYGLLGYYLFQKRKMENNETSFKSSVAHYVVKGITLLPVCLLTFFILESAPAIGWLISIACIIIYSIIYDLITKKEIYKFVYSTLLSLLLFLIFTGFYYLDFRVTDNSEETIKHIDTIIYEGMPITDESIKNQIIKSFLNINAESYFNNYNFTFTVGNQKYRINSDITPSLEKTLNAQLQEYNEKRIKEFAFDHISYLEYNDTLIPVTKELVSLIKAALENITHFDLETIEDKELLYIYCYQNHDYESIFIPVKLSEQLYQKILTYQNELFINYKEENSDKSYSYYELYAYENDLFTELDYYLFNYVINSNEQAFLKYLKNENETNINKENGYIRIYDLKDYTVTISDINHFYEEFNLYKEKLSSNQEYQDLIKEYQEMIDNGVSFE